MHSVCGRLVCSILCHTVTIAVFVATLSGSAAAQKISDQDPTLREYQGTVESIQKFVFSARFDGLLSKINFVPGQVVKEGEIVFEFSPTSKLLALERSRAQRERAEAELRNTKNVLGRFQKLGGRDRPSCRRGFLGAPERRGLQSLERRAAEPESSGDLVGSLSGRKGVRHRQA